MKMERFCLLTFICFVIISSSESFIEEETLDGMVATLKLSVQGLQGRVAALENQCGCNAGPPVFMAALSADLLHCTKHQPVIFDAVKVNRGSGYNNKHGIFQAPVAGIYAFSATLSVEPNNAFHVAIVRGNATNEIGYLYADPQNIWLQRSTTIFTHLDQNEEVWMVCLSDSRIEGDHQHGWEGANDFHSHMSGFLVSADGNSSLYQLN